MAVQHRHSALSLALLVCLLGRASSSAQDVAGDATLSADSLWQLPAAGAAQGASANRSPRVRLFRIAPAFQAEPLGLYEAEELPGVTPRSEVEQAPDEGPDWLQIWMGSDNPYLDFRQPGDPGGLGFYRIYTQMQLFETASSGCALNMQAVTPAGIQYWGLPNGVTVFTPTLSFYHAVNPGMTLQGFVGKNLPVSDAGLAPCLQRRVECGVGVQQALNRDGLYLSLEGLAQTPADHRALEMPPALQVLPGMQWQVDEGWWLSSGVLMPTGISPLHHPPGRWQMTCLFQF
jgi:hypothetical protein